MISRGIGVALALLLAAGVAHSESLRPEPARAQVIARRGVRADGLTAAEQARLLGGETISRPMVVAAGQERWVGGVSYQVVRARPAEVLAALGNIAELPQMLPRTKAARLVDVTRRGARVELTQGNQLVDTTYTLLMKRRGQSELRFRLDPSRPHGIKDLWGFVRVRSLGRGQTLVTVAVALDVGPGLVRTLFEDRIQRVILDTPRQIRDYLEPRALARRELPASPSRM